MGILNNITQSALKEGTITNFQNDITHNKHQLNEMLTDGNNYIQNNASDLIKAVESKQNGENLDEKSLRVLAKINAHVSSVLELKSKQQDLTRQFNSRKEEIENTINTPQELAAVEENKNLTLEEFKKELYAYNQYNELTTDLNKRENKALLSNEKVYFETLIELEKKLPGNNLANLDELKNSFQEDFVKLEAIELEDKKRNIELKKMALSKEKELSEAIDKVTESINKLLEDDNLKQMGDKNSKKMSAIINEMQQKLSNSETTQEKSNIIEKDLKKMIDFVENVEKKAGKNKFTRIKKVLTTALVVIVTAGFNKSAKEKFAEAKLIMSSKNASKIKEKSSQLGKDLKDISFNSRNKANSFSR